ncbi:MAG: hypothetical protein C7B46_14455 [Sulfobacillus benefaciens]|uniref:Uncharacterized protein n=1 Tax=Sulfobacillus benefaciens TaxID=453960 RepID=A0A2T2XD82_9FIRM|nr:MAG: hypothetical protein C7B46_14455 [Sulfobacillus benefaciens]
MAEIPEHDTIFHDAKTLDIPLKGLPLASELTDHTQSLSFLADYQIHGYRDLTDNAICVVLWGYYTVNSGIVHNTADYKALFLYAVDHAMTPYRTCQSPFSPADNRGIDLAVTAPNSVNNTTQSAFTTSVTHTVTFGIDGSVGFMMGDPMGNLSENYSDTTSRGASKTVVQELTDWSIKETSAPANAQTRASWIHHQTFPYDPLTLGNFESWWPMAYTDPDHSPNPLKDLPDLSTATMKFAANASWRFAADLIKQLDQPTLHFMMERGFSLACITNNAHSDNGHNRLATLHVGDTQCYEFDIHSLLP